MRIMIFHFLALILFSFMGITVAPVTKHPQSPVPLWIKPHDLTKEILPAKPSSLVSGK